MSGGGSGSAIFPSSHARSHSLSFDPPKTSGFYKLEKIPQAATQGNKITVTNTRGKSSGHNSSNPFLTTPQPSGPCTHRFLFHSSWQYYQYYHTLTYKTLINKSSPAAGGLIAVNSQLRVRPPIFRHTRLQRTARRLSADKPSTVTKELVSNWTFSASKRPNFSTKPPNRRCVRSKRFLGVTFM